MDAQLKAHFTHLHANPEPSWQEVQTTAYLAQALKKLGLSPVTFDDMTGLYVDIGEGIPRVGVRTDIDSLWQEVDGVFRANHSCGHDGHMTMALGVAEKLAGMQLDGAVRILFQPAEEKASGAKAFVEKGIVDDLQFLFGTHVRPLVELPDGVHAPAIYHGAAKLITGTITGVEAHGARPEQGVNAIEVAAALVDSLKRVWINPNESASIKMTQIQAGGASTNIIPGSATFSLDVRAQTNDTMHAVTQGLERAIEAVSTLYNATITTKVGAHIAAATVDEQAKNLMQQAIIQTVGEAHCAPAITTPGGEDFHFYTYKRPHLQTTMLGLGCGVTPGLHHPHMTFNVEQLQVGVAILTKVVLLALEQIKGSDTL